eukprot:9498770-Pyramimonas_sp.AAC.1
MACQLADRPALERRHSPLCRVLRPSCSAGSVRPASRSLACFLRPSPPCSVLLVLLPSPPPWRVCSGMLWRASSGASRCVAPLSREGTVPAQ